MQEKKRRRERVRERNGEKETEINGQEKAGRKRGGRQFTFLLTSLRVSVRLVLQFCCSSLQSDSEAYMQTTVDLETANEGVTLRSAWDRLAVLSPSYIPVGLSAINAHLRCADTSASPVCMHYSQHETREYKYLFRTVFKTLCLLPTAF